MKIDLYQSVRNREKYLAVPAGTDVAVTPFPNTLDPDLHKVSPFKHSLEIQPGDGRAGFDSAEVIRQIDQSGFATVSAVITVTVR